MLNFTLSSIPTEQDFTPLVEPSSRRRLLIVDDEPMLLIVLTDIFQELYDLKTAESGEAALDRLASGFQPEVIIADQRMTGISGAQFLAKSIAFAPKAVRVVLTGYTDVQDIIDSINVGNVYRFLTKPWQREELLEAVRLCFEHYDLTTRTNELSDALAQLETAHRQLKDLSSEKDELLGIAAHDLKNPLQAIREFATMCMEDNEMQEEMRQTILATIVRTSNRMFEIIKNLLNINALERGAMAARPVVFAIASVARYVVEDYQARAKAKDITLHFSDVAEARVFADESMTIQVLENLVSNAVKYSPFGKNVFVSVAEHSSSQTRIEIRDEGPGISAEEQQLLFGKFIRLSARPTGDEHSTGLGLSIVKKMVEAMNGKVWCESELGKGARFIVELPRESVSVHA
jgi:two-component system, sensor histidine kinase and response regulator